MSIFGEIITSMKKGSLLSSRTCQSVTFMQLPTFRLLALVITDVQRTHSQMII